MKKREKKEMRKETHKRNIREENERKTLMLFRTNHIKQMRMIKGTKISTIQGG